MLCQKNEKISIYCAKRLKKSYFCSVFIQVQVLMIIGIIFRVSLSAMADVPSRSAIFITCPPSLQVCKTKTCQRDTGQWGCRQPIPASGGCRLWRQTYGRLFEGFPFPLLQSSFLSLTLRRGSAVRTSHKCSLLFSVSSMITVSFGRPWFMVYNMNYLKTLKLKFIVFLAVHLLDLVGGHLVGGQEGITSVFGVKEVVFSETAVPAEICGISRL